jgi:hypothetical protein
LEREQFESLLTTHPLLFYHVIRAIIRTVHRVFRCRPSSCRTTSTSSTADTETRDAGPLQRLNIPRSARKSPACSGACGSRVRADYLFASPLTCTSTRRFGCRQLISAFISF